MTFSKSVLLYERMKGLDDMSKMIGLEFGGKSQRDVWVPISAYVVPTDRMLGLNSVRNARIYASKVQSKFRKLKQYTYR